MPLDYLLHRQQIEMMRADAAACVASRHAHRQMARLYAAELERSAPLPAAR